MPIDPSRNLAALFAAQAAATPAAPALEDSSVAYSYAELQDKVDALAARLQHAHGVGRDTPVGVLLPRSADYVVACLAALRAGGAFLVLELAYPPDLLADVLADARPAVVITHGNLVDKVRGAAVPLILLDEKAGVGLEPSANGDAKMPALEPVPEHDLDRLAFISYSSGTTGRPKGIANPHRAAVLSYNLRFEFQDVYPGDRVACNVFFIWEILRPLLRGATVVAVPDEVSYDQATLVDLLESQRITETLMTPTLLATVLSRQPHVGERLPVLRALWLNGEVVTTDLASRAIKAMPNTRLLNVYSASETHEVACGDIREMFNEQASYSPVGPSIVPKHTYVLDESGQKVPEGEVGELVVGGPLLARGYLNLAETTAKAFIPDPFDGTPGARMYRTGDTARILPSGALEITGRIGAMIKLRGYSVVPAKVESEILKHLAVSACAVVPYGDGLERQLVAYIVRDPEADTETRPVVEINKSCNSPAARRVLAPYLAHYMLPALWIELDLLPTNEVSGKVDLKQLPPPRPSSPAEGEKKDPIRINDIAGVWAATLKTARGVLKPEDNFFDLGGHSLLLADLASRLSNKFHFRVPISRLADNATMTGHLETVRAVRDGHTAAIQADLPAILKEDATLEEDIIPRDKPMLCPINAAKTVLLTGVTGFLGAFLLNEILERTTATVICMVRFTDPEDDDQPSGAARIRRNLLDLGLWRDSIMERVEILPGNLSRPRLGLPLAHFDELAARVDVIFHAAATVNLVYPYAALRGANVGGTREILRLASQGGATVQYVSTNGVLPRSPADGSGWGETAALTAEEVQAKLADGYGQTKWVAEQLVLAAGRRGLPVRVHRAGTISGHSQTGAANAWDLLSALVVESIILGHAPDVEGWRAELTPVDFVSRAMVELATRTTEEAATVQAQVPAIFHLGDPAPVSMRTVFAQLTALGYPTTPISWESWTALWQARRSTVKGGEGAFTIDILRSGMPTADFLRDIVVLDNAATRPLHNGVPRPAVDEALLATYTRHWFARGWLPHPPKAIKATGQEKTEERKGSLAGRVAVVTGASSGIGAAVVRALVAEGCDVALGARRLDELERVRTSLPGGGGRGLGGAGRCVLRATDVTDADAVTALVAAAAEFGNGGEKRPPGGNGGEGAAAAAGAGVDILVACAGVMYFTHMAEGNHAGVATQWARTVDVNCKGLLHALAATVPGMLARGRGHVVAISSDAGRKVFPGLGVYSASKFFTEATLQALRLETAGRGLRVTSVQPGNTATPLLAASAETDAAANATAAAQYGGASGARILTPGEVADAIVFALSRADHVAVNELLVEPRDEPV